MDEVHWLEAHRTGKKVSKAFSSPIFCASNVPGGTVCVSIWRMPHLSGRLRPDAGVMQIQKKWRAMS